MLTLVVANSVYFLLFIIGMMATAPAPVPDPRQTRCPSKSENAKAPVSASSLGRAGRVVPVFDLADCPEAAAWFGSLDEAMQAAVLAIAGLGPVR